MLIPRNALRLALGALLAQVALAAQAGEPGRAVISDGILPVAHRRAEAFAEAQLAPVAEPAPLAAGAAYEGTYGPETGPGYGPYTLNSRNLKNSRGFVSLTYTPRECCSPLGCRLQCRTHLFLERSAVRRDALGRHLRCALAPLRPLTYWDAGYQNDVIALNPGYTDPRDGQTFAAQGYGIPISVPLAPVVGDQYNYSWGLPSSRLTPIARPAAP